MIAARTHRGAGPIRTCVGCRQVDEQHALLRVTCQGESLVLDDGQKRIGRGAYVHAQPACFKRAERGGFSRSFRKSIRRDSVTFIGKHIMSVQGKGSDE